MKFKKGDWVRFTREFALGAGWNPGRKLTEHVRMPVERVINDRNTEIVLPDFNSGIVGDKKEQNTYICDNRKLILVNKPLIIISK